PSARPAGPPSWFMSPATDSGESKRWRTSTRPPDSSSARTPALPVSPTRDYLVVGDLSPAPSRLGTSTRPRRPARHRDCVCCGYDDTDSTTEWTEQEEGKWTTGSERPTPDRATGRGPRQRQPQRRAIRRRPGDRVRWGRRSRPRGASPWTPSRRPARRWLSTGTKDLSRFRET